MAAATPHGSNGSPALGPEEIPATVQTFATLCSQASYDPHGGNYKEVYDALNASALSTEELLDRLFESAVSHPLYFLICVGRRPTIQVVHHPFTVHDPIGAKPSGLDGQRFVLVGDVIDGQFPPAVECPRSFLRPVVATGQQRWWVMKPVALYRYFVENRDAEWAPKPIPEEARQEVPLRRSTFIPAPLAGPLLGGSYTPRMAFLEIMEALIKGGGNVEARIGECVYLLYWLSLCCMDPGQNHRGYELEYSHTHRPEVRREVSRIVERELPSPGTIPIIANNNERSMDRLNHTLLQMAESWATGQTRSASTPTVSPGEFYGINLQSLLRILQIDTPNELPQVYRDLASCKKGQQLSTLQSHFRTVADQLGVKPPLVSKRVQEFFVHLRFSFPNPAALLEGISPFLFPPLSPKQKVSAEDLYLAYEAVQQAGNLTLDEAARIEAIERRAIPIRTYRELREVLGSFHVFLHVMLDTDQGGQHPLIGAWDLFWAEFKRSANENLWYDEAGKPGRAFQIVRWIHMRTANWGEIQHAMDSYNPVPNYLYMWDGIRNTEDGWVPRFDVAHMPYGAVPPVPSLPPRPQFMMAPELRNQHLRRFRQLPRDKVKDKGVDDGGGVLLATQCRIHMCTRISLGFHSM
jgi:hypothetical protein